MGPRQKELQQSEGVKASWRMGALRRLRAQAVQLRARRQRMGKDMFDNLENNTGI